MSDECLIPREGDRKLRRSNDSIFPKTQKLASCVIIDCNLHGFPEEIETRNTWKYYRSSVEYVYSMVSRLHIFYFATNFISILLIRCWKIYHASILSYRQKVVDLKSGFYLPFIFLSFFLFFPHRDGYSFEFAAILNVCHFTLQYIYTLHIYTKCNTRNILSIIDIQLYYL